MSQDCTPFQKAARHSVEAENPVLLGDTDPESATCFTTSLNSSSRSNPHDWMIAVSHASLSIAQESGRRPSAKRLGYAQGWRKERVKVDARKRLLAQCTESGRFNSDDDDRR